MGGYIMENAVDSLKIAFGVLIFTVALSISISTFSNARRAIDGITTICLLYTSDAADEL